MPQSFSLPSTVDRSSAHPPISDEGLARSTTLNLLIMGTADDVERFVTSLWPALLTPRVLRRPGEPLRLLSTSQPGGTILVYDVDTLTRPEQDALNRWISAENNRTRIVSTATKSLLPVLETGAFNDELYYRLNMLTYDLRSL